MLDRTLYFILSVFGQIKLRDFKTTVLCVTGPFVTKSKRYFGPFNLCFQVTVLVC